MYNEAATNTATHEQTNYEKLQTTNNVMMPDQIYQNDFKNDKPFYSVNKRIKYFLIVKFFLNYIDIINDILSLKI